MDDKTTYLAFNCLNPDCGHQIKFTRPAKTGVYEITCPHCHTAKRIKIKGLDAVTQVQQKAATPATPAADGGTADNSAKEELKINGEYITGTTHTVRCPHCHAGVIRFMSEKGGELPLVCPTCKGRSKVEVHKPTEILPVDTDTIQPYNGKLTLVRKGWLNKTYALREGSNVIGRYDEEVFSDIAIKNDPNMSRRSVNIEVLCINSSYFFKLTVMKATNPIFINGEPLNCGEAVSLRFGDTILMGKTKFRFEQC